MSHMPSENNNSSEKPQGLPVSIFSVIQLRHKETGRYLCSIPKHCQGDSYDQYITATETEPTPRSYWLVRPGHLFDHQRKAGESVGFGEVIRLENAVMSSNLHSHNRNAPITGNQLEITTFGKDGFCNADDNWVFNVTGSTSHLVSGAEVLLHHIVTKMWLHSHSIPLGIQDEDLNEVTGY